MSKARGLADLGNVYNDGALSNRNLIINGAMQVAQRGTSFTSGNYQYTLDRWSVGGGHTVSQYTDASGKKWLDATNSNATWFSASQKIENGDYLARNNSVTVSFDWEQVTATAVASVRLFNNIDLDEYINIPEPSVSGRKTITFTVGAISLGSGWLGVGVYNAYANAQSGRFRITNVQLEVGDTATPFEHRSFGQELALCQRYYEKNFNVFDAPVAGLALPDRVSGLAWAGSAYGFNLNFSVTKRSLPTMVYYRGDTAGSASSGTVCRYNGAGWVEEAISGAGRQTTQFIAQDVSTSGLTFGYTYLVQVGFTADAEL